MKEEFELDFTNQIKARKLDELKYTGTPEVFLKTSRSDFRVYGYRHKASLRHASAS